MRKSIMFRLTVVVGAMFVGAIAFAQMEAGAEAVDESWTIGSPTECESYVSPVTSIAVAGGHGIPGVSAYVCKIRPHGSNAVTGSVSKSCNQDGSWGETISFAASPDPNMYDAGVFKPGSLSPDDYHVFYIDPVQ